MGVETNATTTSPALLPISPLHCKHPKLERHWRDFNRYYRIEVSGLYGTSPWLCRVQIDTEDLHDKLAKGWRDDAGDDLQFHLEPFIGPLSQEAIKAILDDVEYEVKGEIGGGE